MKPIDDYKQQIEAWKLDVAALREENARLRAAACEPCPHIEERDEARAEVKRLEGLILDWYEKCGDDTAWSALAMEAERIRGER